MGSYLNSKKACLLYQDETEATYFVDKTAILDELIPLIEQRDNTTQKGKSNKYICITRPRRFGKSVMASMIAAYLGRGRDSASVFDRLAVSSRKWYRSHLNRHNVIYISLNSLPANCTSYQQYITRISERILRDLKAAYPSYEINETDAIWDVLNDILESEEENVKFIFILDEWDFIFHRDFVTDKDKAEYIDFLSNLLKDQPYVELAYMTGILPIAKYSSGSELNMFYEYTMASEERFSEYFCFTEEEADTLFARYQTLTAHQKITFGGLPDASWESVLHMIKPRKSILAKLKC